MGADAIHERWVAEQHIDRELAQELQTGIMQINNKSIALDDTPRPYIAFELQCPRCGYLLYREFVKDFGLVYDHARDSMTQCPGLGRKWTIGPDLQVRRFET